MAIDPYTPPKESSDGPPQSLASSGRPCPECRSRNTGREELLHSKPGIFWFLMFGWFFLLVRTALARQANTCRDCGATFRYKTVGSWVALAVLLLIILISATAAI